MQSAYASGRNKLPFTSTNISISSDGNLPAQTIFLSIQGKNLAGYNLPSNLVSATIPANGKVTVSLPALNTGEYYKEIVLSASTTNDVNSLVQVASISVSLLPTVVTLQNPQDLELSKQVATVAQLPTNVLRGAIRYVNELTKYFQYLPDSPKSVDGVNVLAGKWIRIGSFSTTIANFSGEGGANQPLSEIVEATIDAPPYAADGSKGEGIIYFLSNTTTSTLNAGTSVKVSVFVDSENKTAAFNSLLVLEVLGYSNLTTGELDNSIATGEILFKPNENNVTLTKVLNPGNAVVLKVSPKFTVANVSNIINSNSSVLSVLPYLLLGNTSTYVPGSPVIGNSIYSSSDKMAIVPWTGLSVKKLSGSANVGGYEISNSPEEIVGGLQANTANQYILLTSNGGSFSSTTTVEGTVIRAIVSTEDGIGFPSNWSEEISLNETTQLQVLITYPTFVRADYPDQLIKNNVKGKFNAFGVRIYLQSISSENVYYTDKLVTPNEESDSYVLNFSNFVDSGDGILFLPSNDYFGLFAASTPTTQSINSSLGGYSEDTYKVAIAFKYEDRVTSINHSSSLGSIPTTTGSLVDVLENVENFQEHLQNLDNPHEVTALQVGKTIAQWNASHLQGNKISSQIPFKDKQTLIWNETEKVWTPGEGSSFTKLDSSKIYYVSITGNDANDGLTTNSSFATIKKAIKTATVFDFNGFYIKIEIAPGNYEQTVELLPQFNSEMYGGIVIEGSVVDGNLATIISGFPPIYSDPYQTGTGYYEIRSLILEKQDCYALIDLEAYSSGLVVNLDSIQFNSTSYNNILAAGTGVSLSVQSVLIKNSSRSFLNAVDGAFVDIKNGTITLVNNPEFSLGFIRAHFGANINSFNFNFVGAATGKRFSVKHNSIITTAFDFEGNSLEYFPGSEPGIIESGGVYIGANGIVERGKLEASVVDIKADFLGSHREGLIISRTADTSPKIIIYPSGDIEWGDGTNTNPNINGTDTYLYRAEPNCLETGRLRLEEISFYNLQIAPTSSTDVGEPGEIRFTSDAIYVCVAPSQWKKTPLIDF